MTSSIDAKSITHVHLLRVVATELKARQSGAVRLLDVGCGDGALVEYVFRRLPDLAPGVTPEIYGFDVCDHGVQAEGFMDATLATLAAAHRDVPWGARISSIGQDDAWPYEDASFDAVMSNQVMEHVADHDRVFAETSRVLRDGGYAVHLFPLKHCLWEDHLNLPLAHRIVHHDLLRWYIKSMSRLGFGKFGEHRRLLKLRSMTGRALPRAYRRQSAVGEWLAFLCLRYASSITLFLEKRQTFRQK
jgi:SAM-dependent methyltransferase